MGRYLPCARANAANSGTLDSFVKIHVLVTSDREKFQKHNALKTHRFGI